MSPLNNATSVASTRIQ